MKKLADGVVGIPVGGAILGARSAGNWEEMASELRVMGLEAMKRSLCICECCCTNKVVKTVCTRPK